jgi:hypothetical protein
LEAAIGFEPMHRGFAVLSRAELKGKKGLKTTLWAGFFSLDQDRVTLLNPMRHGVRAK